jgi:hypothetical protein
MPMPTVAERQARQHQLLLLREPTLWPHWPFLPVVRREDGRPECGLLFDAKRVCGRYGYSATVFLTSMLRLPTVLDELLAIPREVYDTADEVFEAGWRVD